MTAQPLTIAILKTDSNIVVKAGTICVQLRRFGRPVFRAFLQIRTNVSHMPTPTWFVTYHPSARLPGQHTRRSEQFANEQDAKVFARARVSEVLDVTAGTINPHLPKRFIGSAQIAKWLDE